MGFREILDKAKSKMEERKSIKNQMETQDRISENIAMKKLSANERELLRLKKREHEENVKSELAYYRKRQALDDDIRHNPLNVPNVMVGGNDILKQQNIFSNKENIFSQESSLFFR